MKRFLGLALICLMGFSLTAAADEYDIYSRLDLDPGYSFHSSPEDWRDVNMYQLFTDRFYDGDSGNNYNRYMTTGSPWYNETGSSAEDDRHLFQGGDWAGITQKLPYLKNMGVKCVWISGVQLNEQGFDKKFTPYHAYHPANFYKVEPMFGTFEELKTLIDTAHAEGIYVVLDVVVNHMADLFKYTDCGCNYEGYCESNCGPLWWWDESVQFAPPFNSPDNFHNNGTIGDNDWDTYPKYIKGAFLGTEDLKTEDPYVQQELKNIFKHLIDSTDCDGFRVDAIKHMEYDFIKQWADDIRKHAAYRGKNNFILFGEYFSYDDGVQASYCKDEGYSFNSTLWFPMQMTMKNVFAYEQGTTQLGSRLNAMSQYGEAANNLVAFMDNHDVDRFALECGSSWEAKMRPALTFLYTATPVPCLFYGTEHGFNQGERRNGSPKLGQADFQRECMMDFGFQWGNAQGDKFTESPLYNHIKTLNQLREQYIALRRGNLSERWSDGGKGIYAYTRTYGDEEALVVINTDWGDKSCNPDVSKPDGTVYENVLNPGETATVSGGKLSVTVGSKGSKIYVAGQGNSAVETSCNTETLTITYKPNNGSLASPVGSVMIGIGHDGEQDMMYAAMTPSGANWTYAYAISNAAEEVNFWFYDEDTPPTYDNNGGLNWDVDITGCGAPDQDLTWTGNENHWPGAGEWDAGEDLWVNIESYPQNSVIDGEVVYSADGGTTWTNEPLSFNGTNGNNDQWHANLGRYSGGTSVEYAIRLTGRNGDFWKNNGGSNYSAQVNASASAVTWIGNTQHWPENGSIETDNELWINVESQPVDAGVTGEVVYSTNGGADWLTAGLSHAGVIEGKDWWHVNLGTFNPETTIRYAVKVVDGESTEHWDNNGGSNYLAQVNDAPSSIRWHGNVIQGGAPRPFIGLQRGSNGLPVKIEADDLASNAMYTVLQSTDLKTWTSMGSFTADEVNEVIDLVENTNSRVYYSVRIDWVSGPAVYNDRPVIISIESWPAGGASGANLIWDLNNSSNWTVTAMHHAGTRGNNDIWTATLGILPLGSEVKYAVELLDENDESLWNNNDAQDYRFTVLDPNVTDHEAPTTSYSPQNTTTSNETLDVTLSATDDQDPSPTIYYTTDESEPTTGSSIYSGAITVTDQGSSVDMTIKFFARDATGNASEITTIEVKVNHGFSYGGSTPYSSNPTLGQRVSNGAITADGINNSEWDDAKLIALDMANDDPRSLGDNWTMHEAPIDLTHLWAAWDDNNLYLAWQYVDVTDIIDPANAGSAGGGRINSNDGILQWIALDTKSGGASLDMWGKNNGNAYWTGSDLPDVQIYMAGSLWQGYLSRAQNGVFPVDDGGVNYFSAAAAGVTYGTGNSFQDDVLWGVGDADNRFGGGAPDRNFLGEGHSTSRDSFYEIAIPLSTLQITAAELESNGIGVMLAGGSESAMDSIPHSEATLDTPGVETYNSSFEWGDTDSFADPFVRIGAGK